MKYLIKRVDGRANETGKRGSPCMHVCEPNVTSNLNQESGRRYEWPATNWVFHLMKICIYICICVCVCVLLKDGMHAFVKLSHPRYVELERLICCH